VSLLAARTEAIIRYRDKDPTLDDAEINARLVAYCSDQACIGCIVVYCVKKIFGNAPKFKKINQRCVEVARW